MADPSQGLLFGAPRSTQRTIVFDLETQNSFDDVGGRNRMSELRMSVGVTLAPDTGEFHVYRENEAPALIEELRAAGRVIGFNHKSFDYAVLGRYTKLDWSTVNSFDILEDLTKILGHRVKLDSVAAATLGTKKSGHGLQAIEWFRKGEWETLIRYCKDDVKITADVWKHGVEKKFVMIESWSGPKKVPVTWA
ncbi:MAG: ribonuclease H-like domain-containing protein [Candidatus Brocadiae bacterium]|nr:ribonuclease H-like domain-containing protein [Candidatus Brocadiia bacterium]